MKIEHPAGIEPQGVQKNETKVGLTYTTIWDGNNPEVYLRIQGTHESAGVSGFVNLKTGNFTAMASARDRWYSIEAKVVVE